jgi:hypothetical protein
MVLTRFLYYKISCSVTVVGRWLQMSGAVADQILQGSAFADIQNQISWKVQIGNIMDTVMVFSHFLTLLQGKQHVRNSKISQYTD